MMMLRPQPRDAKVEKGRRQGELFRRYWQPVCTSDELSDLPKKVKILAKNSLYSATRKEESAPSNSDHPLHIAYRIFCSSREVPRAYVQGAVRDDR